MQCNSCGASDPRESENCPECQSASASSSTPKSTSTAKPKKTRPRGSGQRPVPSTLIEFPGGGRVPQWRKELSERVREVQKRRALEAATEARVIDTINKEATRPPEPAPLGLVRPAAAPAINPLVMKALLRIERAHRVPAQALPSYSRGGTALARQPEVAVPEIETLTSIEPQELATDIPPEPISVPPSETTTKEHSLTIVPALERSEIENEAAQAKQKTVRVITNRIEEEALSYLENLQTTHAEFGTTRDDRAGLPSRVMAAIVDLIMIALTAGPFGAGIELWGGNWNTWRVRGLMAGITLVVGFMYLTFTTALAGRTLGMRLFGIRAVDVRTGLMPSGSQSARRAFGYLLSLATAGIGIFYGLIDGERRTAHDHFSGTIVVHDHNLCQD